MSVRYRLTSRLVQLTVGSMVVSRVLFLINRSWTWIKQEYDEETPFLSSEYMLGINAGQAACMQ
jgi:hypothetical protein